MWDNCPEIWRENCSLRDVACTECKAYQPGNSRLKYKPLSPSLPLNKHPAYKKKNNPLVKIGRAAKRHEQKVVKKIAGSSPTLNSGAVNGDGDGKTRIGDLSLQLEHKSRSNQHLLGPTAPEWDKALAQGVDVFVCTSSKYGSVATLKLELLNQLLEIAQEYYQSLDLSS